jgi:flagellar protein FlgJ
MIEPTTAAPGVALSPEEARLRRACAQMEGVFLAQLMKAMRDTIPQDGAIDGGAGEDMFTSMMDEQVSDIASARQERGIGAALFRQLRSAFFAGASEGASAAEPVELDAGPAAGAAAAANAASRIGTGA